MCKHTLPLSLALCGLELAHKQHRETELQPKLNTRAVEWTQRECSQHSVEQQK